jgi:hypothetical protein
VNTFPEDPYELIGGVPALAIWANENPGQFFVLLFKEKLLTEHDWTYLYSLLSPVMQSELLRYARAAGAVTDGTLPDGRPYHNIKIRTRQKPGRKPNKKRTRAMVAWEREMQRINDLVDSEIRSYGVPDMRTLADKIAHGMKVPKVQVEQHGNVTHLVVQRKP